MEQTQSVMVPRSTGPGWSLAPWKRANTTSGGQTAVPHFPVHPCPKGPGLCLKSGQNLPEAVWAPRGPLGINLAGLTGGEERLRLQTRNLHGISPQLHPHPLGNTPRCGTDRNLRGCWSQVTHLYIHLLPGETFAAHTQC